MGNAKGRPYRLTRSLAFVVFAGLFIVANFQGAFAEPESGDYEFKFQEEDNYCGIALMQTVFPYLSQDDIAKELRKGDSDLTFWGDFTYFFNKHGVDYHFSSLSNEFPAIILLSGTTFGLTTNHYVLVLDKRNSFYYLFDPKRGFYKKPMTYLEGSRALVLD